MKCKTNWSYLIQLKLFFCPSNHLIDGFIIRHLTFLLQFQIKLMILNFGLFVKGWGKGGWLLLTHDCHNCFRRPSQVKITLKISASHVWILGRLPKYFISSSAVHEHCRLEGHSVDPNKIKVLSTEVNTFKRRIKEAIQIKLTKPALNRDNGYELAAIYDTILTPKRR